jgi:hypothetical protein
LSNDAPASVNTGQHRVQMPFIARGNRPPARGVISWSLSRVMEAHQLRLARYFLLRHGETWLVTLEGQVMTRAATRSEAIEAAIVMADLMGAMHHDADVMIEKEAGAGLEIVWAFGRDKLPKRLQKHRSASGSASRPHVRLVQRGEAVAT